MVALPSWRVERGALPRILVTAVVVVLLLVGALFPLWEMKADVRPLGMFSEPFIGVSISGTGIKGHLESLNNFNKMFGIRPLKPEEFVEMRLFPLALGGTILTMVLWAVWARRWVWVLALVLGWGLPLGIIALTQLRLAIMALTRDPNASYYMETTALMLPVFGNKKVLGAELFTRPGAGLILLVVAALLFTVLSLLLERVKRPLGYQS